jgi:hypothetical protein
MLTFLAGFVAFPCILILLSGLFYFYTLRKKIYCKLFGHKALWDSAYTTIDIHGNHVALWFCAYCNGREEEKL